MKNYFLESCITSIDDAQAAQNNGADRLEVCSRLETQGMTPAFVVVEKILGKINLPLRVMIRETENGFAADAEILEKSLASLELFKSLPIEGFVFGFLKNNELDRAAVTEMLAAAFPLPVTFHKALDHSSNKRKDIEWLNDQSGVDTILTSGGALHASDGAGNILETKNLFSGTTMAGGKINHQNITALHERLGLKWYHGRVQFWN